MQQTPACMLDEQACATTHRPGTAFSRNRHAPERKVLDAKACPKPEPRRFAPTAVPQRHTLREKRLNPMRYATGRWISDRESGRRKTAATASATSHIHCGNEPAESRITTPRSASLGWRSASTHRSRRAQRRRPHCTYGPARRGISTQPQPRHRRAKADRPCRRSRTG